MKPHTALADAFERAGFNTAEVRLRGLIDSALRKHHNNIGRALPTLETSVDDDPELMRQALLECMCRRAAEIGQHDDVNRHVPAGRNGAGQLGSGGHETAARPVREPSASQISAAASVAQSVALSVLDRRKTSDGRPWGNVGAHELDGMDRDGAIARAVKSKLGMLSNTQRFQTLRELMRPETFEQALADAAREGDNAA